MIVYFSGTGNSRYAAEAFESVLNDGLFDAAKAIQKGERAALFSERPWVFVSPTYGWRIPRILEQFLLEGNFSGAKRAYFVMTCGDETGNAQKYLKTLCAKKGWAFCGLLPVVMPENYVAMFPVPEKTEAEAIVRAARPVLLSGAKTVAQGKPFPALRPSLLDRFKSAVVNPLFYRFCVHAKPFFATEGCTGCGLCEKRCPMNNIHLSNGRPVWGGRCTHCMACISYCPANAIEYGKKSAGKPRYRCGRFEAFETSEKDSQPS